MFAHARNAFPERFCPCRARFHLCPVPMALPWAVRSLGLQSAGGNDGVSLQMSDEPLMSYMCLFAQTFSKS